MAENVETLMTKLPSTPVNRAQFAGMTKITPSGVFSRSPAGIKNGASGTLLTAGSNEVATPFPSRS